ncbi:MAG: hypothetical protein WBX15_18510 [Thermoanaerobaculia bacterium]
MTFDPAITQDQFHQFSATVAQAIFPTPVNPARGGGLLGFDVGVAATAIPIDDNQAWWVNSVASRSDLTTSGYLVVPRIVASKGIVFGTLSASFAKIPNSDVKMIGGALDVPIIDGGLVKPTLAVRASYGQISGVDVFDLKTYGAEIFLSKGIGPITPYAGAGITRTNAKGTIESSAIGGAPVTLSDDFQQGRYTLGVRLSLLIPKIVIEATQSETRSYAAKVSFGF